MYTVVDLFAGAGGLSLGFMQTQKYDIKVAFEKVPHMQDTYRRNHPNVEMQGDVWASLSGIFECQQAKKYCN